MSENRLGGLLFWAAVILVLLLIWSKVRIVIWIPLKIGGFLLLVGGLILVIYLFLRLLFGRR
ncbi:MAG: hypothetical protein JXA37_14780 [Chloroflexia bacterium]|nr:hypothetical protein [Chloroflexia bacterium]